MFIRVVRLFNINTNNSYFTTIISMCFIETISTKCQDTFYTPHPQSAVNIETPFHDTPTSVYISNPLHPYNSQPSFSYPFFPARPQFKSPATTKKTAAVIVTLEI